MKCLLIVGREYLHHHQVVEAIYGSFLQQLPLLVGRPYGTQEAGGGALPPPPVSHRRIIYLPPLFSGVSPPPNITPFHTRDIVVE